MLAQSNPPAVHGGEDRSSPEFAERSAHWASAQAGLDHWSRVRPVCGVPSLAELAEHEQTLRAGDIVYITQVRRHVLTDDDLNAAARAVIGGEQ